MIYQNPQLLYALFAIAIPILIHLFNLRKHKRIYFSSIRLLKEIKEEDRRKSELKNILVLLSRILAITFLVLAFAQPYIPADTSKTSDNILFYIDNSHSMDIDFGEGNLLNNAKEKAIEISKAYSSKNNFYLVTNDFLLKNTSSYSPEIIKNQIENIKVSAKQRSISDIISRINSITPNNSHVYFISDFQQNTLQVNNLKKSEIKNRISLIPLKNNNTTNICIDSLFISKPVLGLNEEIKINLIISNNSDEEIKNEVLFLYLEGKQKAQQYISLLPQESREVSFIFLNTNNIISGEIRIQDSPITFDNSFFFTLKKSRKINVTAINNGKENIAFTTLFGNDTSLFNFTSLALEEINYDELSKENLIILNEIKEINSGLLNKLISFTNNGGNILVVPPTDLADVNFYNIFLNSLGLNTIKNKTNNTLRINQFSTDHPIYKNVFNEAIKRIDYPNSKKGYFLNKKITSTQVIGFENKQDFLSMYSSGEGTIYQFSSPLEEEYNNFTKHALVVPTLINIATGANILKNLYYIIDSKKKISTQHIKSSTNITHIKGENIDIIPTITNSNGRHILDDQGQITKNGIYSIINDDKIIEKVAFNYNPSENNILSMDRNTIEELIAKNNLTNIAFIENDNISIKQMIKEEEIGKEYWKIAILLSLLFFGLEILLIKLIKL
mgnify:CR=1 FL=1